MGFTNRGILKNEWQRLPKFSFSKFGHQHSSLYQLWPDSRFLGFLGYSIAFSTLNGKESWLKSIFLSYRVKKHPSILEMDTFKVMLTISYLAQDFKCQFLDIEIQISVDFREIQPEILFCRAKRVFFCNIQFFVTKSRKLIRTRKGNLKCPGLSGHPKTMWTEFWIFLTPLPPIVDRHGFLANPSRKPCGV